MSRARPHEIAIVGMGCRFPGGSDLSTYFENILEGKDCIRDVPADRWDPRVFHDPGSTDNDRVPSCRGGYLQSPIWFDAAKQGIMPRTAEGGEPEQFLVLAATLAALEDAGLVLGKVSESRVEIVIGRGNYFNRGNLTRLQHGRIVAQTLAVLSELHPEWTEVDKEAVRADLKASLPPFEAATIPGQLTNATAGRVAHRLDTNGASFVVDAASASSLVALDLAVRALIERRADVAIAGGVYLEADVDFPLVFRQLNAMSRSGTARPFASDADGMLSGEGVGVLVLKRRADAERDGDRIYALVQGLGIASDGRAEGLAAPSARGHARAIRRAYRQSGIDPATVGLVEGHGLGVPAADRAELRALNAIFPAPEHGRRVLGAVSSMIGHAMPAAGMAGLIKTALALYHRVLPPTLHADKPHPLLDQPKSAFALNTKARPWIQPDTHTPRRAGVNAFGFAGINSHVVLEEHASSADSDAPGALRRWESEAILLSATDRAGLIDRVRELTDWLARHPDEDLKDLAYSLNSLREHQPGGARLGLVTTSLRDLAARLTAMLPRLGDPACHTIRDGRGVYFWDAPLLKVGAGGMAFLFPGEGSQYPGMLGDLCLHFPDVRRMFDIADRIALELGERVPPSEHLHNRAAGGSEDLFSTATAVNVVLTSQRALHRLLTRLDLIPDAVLGHSSGEILALAAAGVIRADRVFEDQMGRLGEIFRGFETSGEIPEARLIAVATARDRVETICRELGASDVVVAIDNCPHQVVLAGPPSTIEKVVLRLRDEKIPLEMLPFERAYHTASFEAVLGPIAEFFAKSNFRAPTVPIYSCATHTRMPDDPEAIRELAIAQWTRTVAFRETIETMHSDGLRVFVDVGARGNLAGFVEDILRGKPAFAIAANLPRRSGITQLNHLVAATFAQGASCNTDYLYVRRRPNAIDWNAAERPARTMVELKIGFPEMRLSDDFIARLNRGKSDRQTPTDSGCHWSYPTSAGLAGTVTHWSGMTSGTQMESNRLPESGFPQMAVVSVDKCRNGRAHFSESNPINGTGDAGFPEPSHLNGNGRFDHAARDSESFASTPRDDAMLHFQETMRAFLHTQQEVLAAYLGEPIGDPCISEKFKDDRPHLGVSTVPHSNGRSHLHSHDRLESNVGETITSGPRPGPWAGEIRRRVDGAEVETVLVLDGRNDPLAEHHTLGGRRTSAIDPSLKGLPVLPFAAMAEMTAEVAALVVTPGLVLTGLEQVRAHKWVRYEDSPVHPQLQGYRTATNTGDERVWVAIFNRGPEGKDEASKPVFEAVAIFGVSVPISPEASPWRLDNPRTSQFTVESVYGEGWLFHGPPLQALARIGQFSEQGTEGTIRVLSWEPLLKAGDIPEFHVDPIVLDVFTHLLGSWGLDFFEEGDVIFPLRMEKLEIYGERPAVGTNVECRISVREIQRHRIRVEAEVIRPDGTIWMRIRDWEDWRFHWPGRYRDAFRQAQHYFVGEELTLNDPASTTRAEARAVWLEPPADMGRPVWRDVLEQTQLGPVERADFLATADSDRRRSHELWGRVAAKEAARRIWKTLGWPATYPADLAIVTDERGRPRLIPVDQPDNRSLPAISIAHAEGVAVAVASADPNARVGIDVEPIVDRSEEFETSAFTPSEKKLLDQWQGSSRTEWVARLCCAKQAAAKASGVGKAAGRAFAEVIDVDPDTGLMSVRLAPEFLRNEPTECLASEKLPGARQLVRGSVPGARASRPLCPRNAGETPALPALSTSQSRAPNAGREEELRNEPSDSPPAVLRNEPNLANPMRVISCRRAHYAWAWTLGEGVEP